MRTTVRLDDELIEQLKAKARKENISLTRLLNRALRDGLRAPRPGKPRRQLYREQPLPMGPPKANLDKALALAAALEDEEIVRELLLGK
ncbi:MAG: ribbon-helix-helix protein, CopG family [Pseudomonadota bacterium]